MQPLHLLALGDSYTIGEGVSSEERWSAQLAARLRGEGLSIEEPVIVAHTGWTTAELQREIFAADLKETFDLVFLLIGVNNQYRDYPLGEYRWEFRELLGMATQFAGGNPNRVIVLSIPDWGVTPYAQSSKRENISFEIDAFNAINQGEAVAGGATYIDVTAISRLAAVSPDLLAKDGLHPSGVMYAAWADLALPVILDLIKKHQQDFQPGNDHG